MLLSVDNAGYQSWPSIFDREKGQLLVCFSVSLSWFASGAPGYQLAPNIRPYRNFKTVYRIIAPMIRQLGHIGIPSIFIVTSWMRLEH
jgi:hypothetical protein